jgi:hypothetical protein
MVVIFSPEDAAFHLSSGWFSTYGVSFPSCWTPLSILSLVSESAFFSASQESVISDADLYDLLVFELMLMLKLGRFLSLRDWKLVHLGFQPGIKGTLVGFVLVLVVYFMDAVVLCLLSSSLLELTEKSETLTD